MKAQMKAANIIGERFSVIVGEDEHRTETAVIRDLRSDADQVSVSRSELVSSLNSRLSSLQGAE
jgi:histidyl-tRNA synthetase